jgi:ribosomal protein S18 acetylase RimI-like enzyme
MSVELTELEPGYAKLLREYLFLAIFVPEGAPPLAPEILDDPAIARYAVGWGRAGDLGFLAIDSHEEKDVGAAWLRLWPEGDHGFGFVDEFTPELSMSVRPGWRGQGIGSLLLKNLLAEADHRYPAVSLSVATANPAFNLYRRWGFEVCASSEGSATMRRRGARSG